MASKPIPLELHHKDGNRYNDQLENLILLCPNCHAFTENYRAKNIKNLSA
jgi:predicted HNH restriction endonuclease